MISQPKIYSSYLVQPRILPDRKAQWNGFLTKFFEIKRANPHIFRNTSFILVIWVSVIASVQYTSASPGYNLQASFTLPEAGAPLGSKLSTPAPLAQTAPARPASLAGGPSGQLMPAGAPTNSPIAVPASAFAPFGTYRNSYAWGNCTWYVASRRQVPTNWGNARTWYPRAQAAGWRTGTTPVVGAIAWTSAGYYGHVALVEQVSADGAQVLVSEMNYRGLGIRSSRWTTAASFRYIY